MSRSSDHPLVALISATPASIAPTAAAFAQVFPEAVLWNLLDDRLLPDAQARGGVDKALAARMNRLIDHALREGADAVLLTCSMYGPTAAARQREEATDAPMLAPDGAAFDQLLTDGHRDVVLVASNTSSLADSHQRLLSLAASRGHELQVRPVVVADAVAPALVGDDAALLAALDSGVSSALQHGAEPLADSQSKPQAVLLAQYSLAPVAGDLATSLGLPVYSGPVAAAQVLRRELTGAQR